jgi:phage regulator Rha-like protein
MKDNSISQDILEIKDNEPRISHRVIAKHTNNDQVSVRKLIDKHFVSLELFGVLSFEMTKLTNEKKGGRPEKTYFLNEQQATLLLTFMRNNEIVIEFKVNLVKAFYEMRMQLQKVESPKPLKQINLISVSDSELDRELKALKFVLDNFNLSEKEKISYTNIFFERTNIPTLKNPYLKKHEQVFTLTELLKEFQIPIRTSDFNKKLQSFGIIERFGNGWILLDMKFGENRDFQDSTNPRYYKSTFQELLDIVLEKVGATWN